MKTIISTILCIWFYFSGFTQDLSFSTLHTMNQFFNPSYTALNNDMEGILNYRTQWKSAYTKYNSYGMSFGSNIQPKRKKNQGHLALGINFYKEQLAENSEFSTAMIMTAYHLRISKYSQLSAGLNTGFIGLSINPENGKWESQHDGINYDESIPSGELFQRNQISSVDAGFGVSYTLNTNKNDFPLLQFGFAAIHVNKPSIALLNHGKAYLPVRFLNSATLNIPVGDIGSYIESSLVYQQQATFKSFVFGSSLHLKLEDHRKTTSSFSKIYETFVGAGIYFRNNSAFIINSFLKKNEWTFSFAYDFATNTLKNKTTGAAEFALSYTFPSFKPKSNY